MAYFNLLELRSDFNGEDGIQNNEPIRFQAYNVVELFMYFLPKISFDGASKISILFEKKPNDKERYFHSEYFHISTYYVEESYYERARSALFEDRNEFYLSVIENVLIEIASKLPQREEIVQIIKDTAKKVRDCGYELTIKMDKLSKTSKDRAFKAIVYRQISSCGECGIVEIYRKNEFVGKYEITDKHSYAALGDRINKSEWISDQFVMKSRLNKEVVSVNCANEYPTVISCFLTPARKNI